MLFLMIVKFIISDKPFYFIVFFSPTPFVLDICCKEINQVNLQNTGACPDER
jgi:hypothetical protein